MLIGLCGSRGDATVPIMVLESCQGALFLFYALVKHTWPVGASSEVHLRVIWHVVNRLADCFHLLPFKAAKLRALHDTVLEAEKQAFGDSAETTAAKRSLFDIQVDGITGKGDRSQFNYPTCLVNGGRSSFYGFTVDDEWDGLTTAPVTEAPGSLDDIANF